MIRATAATRRWHGPGQEGTSETLTARHLGLVCHPFNAPEVEGMNGPLLRAITGRSRGCRV